MHEDAAVLHVLELPAQRDRLGAGLPCVQDRLLRFGVVARDLIVKQIDARRNDEPVVGQVLDAARA